MRNKTLSQSRIVPSCLDLTASIGPHAEAADIIVVLQSKYWSVCGISAGLQEKLLDLYLSFK